MSGREIIAVDKPRLRRDRARVNRGFWRKLRRVAGRIPFTEDLLAAWFCATDGDTPLYAKAVLMASLAYFVVPTDLLPDFLAGFGYTDDAAVVLGALQTIGSHLKPKHREAAKQKLRAFSEEAENAG